MIDMQSKSLAGAQRLPQSCRGANHHPLHDDAVVDDVLCALEKVQDSVQRVAKALVLRRC